MDSLFYHVNHRIETNDISDIGKLPQFAHKTTHGFPIDLLRLIQ
ncbi:hypothetical protein SAMN06269250_1503 [Spirosoma fluviale]|uniref:Uncharacterized protein n=1 Tax=Spirosoma fluviale TaxID=1597977 RepID=A0A286FCD5_9BACT|nr:hypothetical protein SAMN06269250_1503 [Spirosoma fluviale]